MSFNLTTKVLCVGLKSSCLGTTVQDDQITTDILARSGAQRGKLRANKTILAEAIKPFKKLRGEARKYFNSVTLPGISEDLRITTPGRLVDLQAKMKEFIDRDASLLTTLKLGYYDAIDLDRLQLGDAFDTELYPAVEDLEGYFRLTMSMCDMPAGDYARIAGLTENQQSQMAEDHQKMLAQVGRDARNTVLGQMTKLIQNIADKLSDTNAVKFHETTFSNLKEYLAMVPDLNITGDPTLEAMRKEAATKLDYSMRVVKDSQILKEQAAESAKAILKTFGQVAGSRRLVA